MNRTDRALFARIAYQRRWRMALNKKHPPSYFSAQACAVAVGANINSDDERIDDVPRRVAEGGNQTHLYPAPGSINLTLTSLRA